MDISNSALLEQYRALSLKNIRVEYPLSYLNQAKVVALVSSDRTGNPKNILGGFILATKAPFRVLEQLPRNVLETNQYVQDRMGKCLEVTGLWLNPKVGTGSIRVMLWLRLFMAVLFQGLCGKTYFVYSYDSSKPKLGKTYAVCRPRRIYEGEVFMEGMLAQGHEIVEIGSLKAVILAFFTKPSFLFKRFFFRSSRLKKSMVS